MKSIHFSFDKIIIISILTYFLIASCDVTDPKKDKPKPEGYQEDIPWPSLADSPWPMFQHDPQGTGRSNMAGASLGILDLAIDSFYVTSSIILDKDKSILIPSAFPAKLFSLKQSGEKNWSVDLGSGSGQILTAPLQDSKGTIYLATESGKEIIAIGPDHQIKWKYKNNYGVGINSLNIDLEGNIYCVDYNKNLLIFSNDGNLKLLQNSEHFSSAYNVPLFSPDGKNLYFFDFKSGLSSFNLSNYNFNWFNDTIEHCIAPLIDSNGLIYVFGVEKNIDNKRLELFVFNSDGSLKWKFNNFNSPNGNYISEPAMDKFGNIYFGVDTLYSVDYSGKLNWKKDLNGYTETPITIDINENIFVVVNNFLSLDIKSFTSTGSLNWTLNLPEERLASGPIVANNRLFLSSYKSSKFYIIK